MSKYFLKMILFLLAILCLLNHGFAQQSNIRDIYISPQFKNIPLREALIQIAGQTKVYIIFSDNLVKGIRVNCEGKNMSLKEILNRILQNTKISYVIQDEQIVLTRKKHSKNFKNTLRGVVKNQSSGRTISYANIVVEKTTLGCVSDENGYYVIRKIPEGHYTVKAVMMGYEPQTKEISLNNGENVDLNFQLKQKIIEMGKITITGDRIWPFFSFKVGLETIEAPHYKYAEEDNHYKRSHLYSSLRLRFSKYFQTQVFSSIGVNKDYFHNFNDYGYGYAANRSIHPNDDSESLLFLHKEPKLAFLETQLIFKKNNTFTFGFTSLLTPIVENRTPLMFSLKLNTNFNQLFERIIFEKEK